MLEKDEMLNKNSTSVKNKFIALGQMIEESILKSVKKNTFMSQNERKTTKWMTPEILDLMEARRKAKADVQKYRVLEKEVQ